MNKKLFKYDAEMKEMAAQIQIAQQEIKDLKLQSVMDTEQLVKFDADIQDLTLKTIRDIERIEKSDAEIQDLKKKNEAMAKTMETMEKINEKK